MELNEYMKTRLLNSKTDELTKKYMQTHTVIANDVLARLNESERALLARPQANEELLNSFLNYINIKYGRVTKKYTLKITNVPNTAPSDFLNSRGDNELAKQTFDEDILTSPSLADKILLQQFMEWFVVRFNNAELNEIPEMYMAGYRQEKEVDNFFTWRKTH